LSEADLLNDVELLRERRDTIKLVVDILEIAINGAKKTEIVYRANLNFKQVQKFLDFLIKKGLISVSSNKRKCYQTTEKGKEFIRRYRKTVELIS
jgi:predicted transcriptional regulator